MSEAALRLAAEERVAETSLRHVAREIGMSAPGLSLFLGGASPRTATLEKIRTWHLRGADGTSVEAARTALYMLASHLPPGGDRVTMIRMALMIIARLHRERGRPGPPWLAPLWDEYDTDGVP
jgi:AcrR family transcriptional regulator